MGSSTPVTHFAHQIFITNTISDMSATAAVADDFSPQFLPGNADGANNTGRLMRAGRWSPDDQQVVIRQVPIPEPGPNQFLVRLACASLCHSDIMAIDAGQTSTLGHEGAGYIESIHTSVEGKDFAIGDKIGFLYIIGCCFGMDIKMSMLN